MLCAGQPGTLSPGPFQQFNCVVNTVMSLLGATVAAFVASSAYHGKFDMVSLQHTQSLFRQLQGLEISASNIYGLPASQVLKCVVDTEVSLLGAAVAAFVASSAYRSKVWNGELARL